MKGECDGRELTPGAPVSVGPGSMSGHNREGGTGIKGEQESATRSLQVPAAVGGAQGNGTRGFSVAELTKVEEVSPARGGLQTPSVKGGAIGSVRVPAFKREGYDKGPGREDEPCVQEGKEKLTIGRIKIPIFRKDGWGSSFKRASHNITSGSLHVSNVEGEKQGSNTRTFSAARPDSHSLATRVGVALPESVMDAKRESQSSAAEAPSMAATKRVSQDGTCLGTAAEASTKKLKKDGGPGVPDVTAGRKVSEGNTTDTGLVNTTAASKRVSQDGAIGLSGMTDIKRIRQEGLAEITGVKSMSRDSYNSVPEPVNCTLLKTPSLSVTTRTGDTGSGGTCEPEGVKSGLAAVSGAPAEIVSQGISIHNPQAEAVKGDKQDGATSQAEPTVKGGSDGNTVKPALPAVRQDKDSRDTEGLKACVGKAGHQTLPTASSPLPLIKKEICETSGREESPGVAGIKQESRDKEEVQNKGGGDTEKVADPPQCPVNSEGKQEDARKDENKDTARECQGKVEEGQVAVGGSSCPPRVKPEMVSIETQCDDITMAADKAIKDEYAFLSEDSGEPGECLGGCEPGKKPHKCCQCDTSFRTPYELSRHGRVHSGERPYQCRLCHRCFKRKDHVEVHTRRHVEDRRHACNDCGVCFVTSSCLLRHQRRTHQAPGTKRPGEGEEGEGELGEIKGEAKDQITSKDAQKNGRRNKKNKPDSTYRPGGKTVCIIKKRNLRQRSYSFVELEDDVECFESDEEDRIPFLKVQEQQRVEEHDEGSSSQSSQLEHSLFPPSLFNPEANLSHLLLLGEVSRLLSHSLIPGSPPEGPTTPASTAGQVGRAGGLPQDDGGDSDDSDCEPPLVACDVTFTEAEGEVFVSLPDDDSAASQPEEVPAQDDKNKVTPPATTKTEPCHAAVKAEPDQPSPSPTPAKGGKPHCMPPTPGKTAPNSPVASKGGGTGFAAMGEPRTAWVVPANNTKGKNTCDACRRRNEANRLAQMEKERQALAAQAALKQKQEPQIKPRTTPHRNVKTEDVKPADKPAAMTPPPKPPACKPQQCKQPVNRRSRKAAITKKRRPGKASGGGNGGGGEANGAAAMPQRPHKCHLCPFNFRSATELKRHASTHSGERPFLCELCGAGFMRKCHLQLHVRRHSGERRHACQECRMRFFTPSDLARHQAIHQAGDKPLECHLCHLTFRRAFHLERHIRRHNEAAPFACKLCGAFFSSAAALRSHDKHHRTPGPHACPDCTAAFTTATALSRHRRVHSARHHRLLRAIERHATAKSSYECVSSEESPLSLVIRKVSATVVTPGESGKDTPADSPDLPDHNGEEKENKDSITSGLSNTDKETSSKMEGREMDVSSPLTNKETEQDGKTASSLSTTDNEVKEEGEGEEIIATPSAPDKIKEDRKENITSSPSISEKSEDNREKNVSSTDREKEGSKASDPTISTGEINEESGNVTSSPSMTEKEVDNTEVSSNGCTVEESATDSHDSLGAINLSGSSTKAGTDVASHNEAPTVQRTNSTRETGNNQSVSREAEMVQKSATKSGAISTEELSGKREQLNVSLRSNERKEAQGRSSCSMLLPTSREMEAVKEEIHCRSTYHLATPSGGQEAALHGAPGSGRTSGEEGGQQGGMRDGVATTS